MSQALTSNQHENSRRAAAIYAMQEQLATAQQELANSVTAHQIMEQHVLTIHGDLSSQRGAALEAREKERHRTEILRNQHKQIVDETNAKCQDQEDAFKDEREAFVLLEQELAKCMANLHRGEHDLLLKHEACLELEDNLQRKTGEMDVCSTAPGAR